MIESDIISYDGSFSDHNPSPMIYSDMMSDLRPRMDIYPCLAMNIFGQQTRWQSKRILVYMMRDSLVQECSDAWVTQEHLSE